MHTIHVLDDFCYLTCRQVCTTQYLAAYPIGSGHCIYKCKLDSMVNELIDLPVKVGIHKLVDCRSGTIRIHEHSDVLKRRKWKPLCPLLPYYGLVCCNKLDVGYLCDDVIGGKVAETLHYINNVCTRVHRTVCLLY